MSAATTGTAGEAATAGTVAGAAEPAAPLSRLEAARIRLAPVFARIAASAAEHEQRSTLPYDETRALAAAGFGALRLPVEQGGGGLTLSEFFEVLVDLGAADSNQPQAWRNHIAFVEDRLVGGTERDRRWLERVAAGDFIGGAWSEAGSGSLLSSSTKLSRTPEGLRLDGVKYYSTGSIFSDAVSVLAEDPDGGLSIVLVGSEADGVELVDDWGGFGQRSTGSGTTRFTDVVVADDDVLPFLDRFIAQEAVYQLVLLAALAGIARAVRDESVVQVAARLRSYPHALAPEPRNDALVQQVVGRIAAQAASAQASVAQAARSLDAVWRAIEAGGTGQSGRAVEDAAGAAAVAVYEAQLTVTDAALEASASVFDALGSSGVQRSAQLDRFWRNARTLTSHNPRIYKERAIGDWYLNGADPLHLYGVPPEPAPAAEG